MKNNAKNWLAHRQEKKVESKNGAPSKRARGAVTKVDTRGHSAMNGTGRSSMMSEPMGPDTANNIRGYSALDGASFKRAKGDVQKVDTRGHSAMNGTGSSMMSEQMEMGSDNAAISIREYSALDGATRVPENQTESLRGNSALNESAAAESSQLSRYSLLEAYQLSALKGLPEAYKLSALKDRFGGWSELNGKSEPMGPDTANPIRGYSALDGAPFKRAKGDVQKVDIRGYSAINGTERSSMMSEPMGPDTANDIRGYSALDGAPFKRAKGDVQKVDIRGYSALNESATECSVSNYSLYKFCKLRAKTQKELFMNSTPAQRKDFLRQFSARNRNHIRIIQSMGWNWQQKNVIPFCSRPVQLKLAASKGLFKYTTHKDDFAFVKEAVGKHSSNLEFIDFTLYNKKQILELIECATTNSTSKSAARYIPMDVAIRNNVVLIHALGRDKFDKYCTPKGRTKIRKKQLHKEKSMQRLWKKSLAEIDVSKLEEDLNNVKSSQEKKLNEDIEGLKLGT